MLATLAEWGSAAEGGPARPFLSPEVLPTSALADMLLVLVGDLLLVDDPQVVAAATTRIAVVRTAVR